MLAGGEGERASESTRRDDWNSTAHNLAIDGDSSTTHNAPTNRWEQYHTQAAANSQQTDNNMQSTKTDLQPSLAPDLGGSE